MVKYCPNCGKEHYEDDLFCKDCNKSALEKSPMTVVPPVNNEPINVQSYQSFDGETPHRKSKLLVIIGVLGIIAILVGVSFSVLIYSNKEDSEITKYYLRNDGPKVNLQSSLTGSISPVIEQGYFATYGYYYQGEKVGTAAVENAGEETYQEIGCSIIKTSGDMDVVIGVNPVKCTFESFEYRALEDNTPYYMSVDFQYSKPTTFTVSTNYQWDRQNSRMNFSIFASGQRTNAECLLPDEYWNLFGSMDYLQVGYSKELKYTMDIDNVGPVEVTMTVRVLEQEDVSVQNGEYKDCYKVEVYQTYEIAGTNSSQTFTSWVNDQRIVPQAETISNSGGVITTLLMKLDEYYTKTPPQQL